jgi:hypothetical protein
MGCAQSMSKSLLIFVWTLAVALSAFTAGRWTAPDNQAAVSVDVAQGLVVNRDNNLSPSAAAPTASPLSGDGSALLNKPTANPQAKHSYATDYQLMQQLIALAARNPQLAMEQTQQLKGALRAKAQAAILEVWGGLDPNAAWNWVQSFQPENRAQFIHLLEVIGRSEPRTAIGYAEKFVAEHRELRKDIYLAVVTGLTQSGAYGQARDLVERMEIEPDTKTELMNLVLGAWATYEPQAAMQWVMTQPEEFSSAATSRMGESWADADPQAAVNFAAGLSSGTARDSLLQPSFKKWLATDPAAAASWLASVPPHKDLDPLISELATQPGVNNGQVKEALNWAGKVQDPELRLSTVTSILSAFKQKDPSAASAYLHELTYLSDAERLQLMEDLAFIK